MNKSSVFFSSNHYIQVILIEIDALFPQLSQSMTTDCSLDCATFYSNLYKLLCKFIS